MSKTGFRNPPIEHQFRKGVSGNPLGRPKGVRSIKSDFRDELAETVSVSDDRGEITVTKQRAIVRRLVAAAVSGDERATAAVISYCARAFPEEESETESAEDRQIVEALGPSHGKRGEE